MGQTKSVLMMPVCGLHHGCWASGMSSWRLCVGGPSSLGLGCVNQPSLDTELLSSESCLSHIPGPGCLRPQPPYRLGAVDVAGQADDEVMCDGVHQVPEAGIAVQNIVQ